MTPPTIPVFGRANSPPSGFTSQNPTDPSSHQTDIGSSSHTIPPSSTSENQQVSSPPPAEAHHLRDYPMEAQLRSQISRQRQRAYLAHVKAWSVQPAPGELRTLALERIEHWLEKPDEPLCLNDLHLTSLPALLDGLTALYADNNRLAFLPALPDSLTELEVSDNALEALPPLPSGLTTLSAMNNRLTSIPEPLPPELLHIYLDSNQLTDLPDSIAALRADCEIQVDGNAFAGQVIGRIQERISASRARETGRGPHISLAIQSDDETDAPPIEEVVASWMNESGATLLPEQHQIWQDFRSATPDAATALSGQLERLRSTAHYTMAPQDLTARVVSALLYLTAHPDVRDTCAAIAVEGTTDCIDRIALAFVEIEEAVINHQALQTGRDQTSKLVHTGTAMFRSQLLKAIANAKADSIPDNPDRVEIILRYWVELSGATHLDLPSKMDAMIFENQSAAVSTRDIQAAKATVMERSISQERNVFLGTWRPWRVFLETHHSGRYQNALQTIVDQTQSLHANLERLSNDLDHATAASGEMSTISLNLRHQIGALKTMHDRIEPTVLGQLTEQIILTDMHASTTL